MRDPSITPISIPSIKLRTGFRRQGGRDRAVRNAVLTTLLALFVSITTNARAAAKIVNVASNTPTLSGTLPLIVAQEFGFFAAEGLEVRTVLIRGGPTAMAALVGGGVDYAFVAGVAAAVVKINKFGDPATVRQVIGHFANQYSIAIGREDIDSLIAATRIEAEAKKLGGPDKFFTRQFVNKALGQSR
ncbi:MAG: hypothetical protein FJ143_18865 [Deltaproteobacteria bacterium]|nr:hypothetical protein [Deltaproteobacteria bacterium]